MSDPQPSLPAPQTTQQAPPTAPRPTPKPKDPTTKPLPRWKVLLHNDDVNDHRYVVQSLVAAVGLTEQDATLRMLEAERQGVALVLTTHKEKAELHQQQLASRNLTVTIEPEEN